MFLDQHGCDDQIKKRHIYYASELIRELIKNNDVETLRIINCGVKVLTLSDAKEKPTDYRLCSEGIKVVYPVRHYPHHAHVGFNLQRL